jgi:hypothetical protein
MDILPKYGVELYFELGRKDDAPENKLRDLETAIHGSLTALVGLWLCLVGGGEKNHPTPCLHHDLMIPPAS